MDPLRGKQPWLQGLWHGRSLRLAAVAVTVMVAAPGQDVFADAPDAAVRARLAAGQAQYLIVEIDSTAADRTADRERDRRHYSHDDDGVHALRVAGYATAKQRVALAQGSPQSEPLLDYGELPLFLWRVHSLQALSRLEADSAVRRVHVPVTLRAVSVNDLAFISQPAVASAGMNGAGTTIAVIDGGLGNYYLGYPDFGACTGVNSPAATCRVAYNHDYYPGASAEVVHGTNVSAIALGVAPGARLAMYDVFNGTGASSTDILSAINSIIALRKTYNTVAVNLSLAVPGSYASTCTGSTFAAAFAALGNAGISTIVAAGNSGSKDGLAEPACVAGAISVGAVYNGSYGTLGWVVAAQPGGTCQDASRPDLVTCFSQSAPYLSLLAPGSEVLAPDPTLPAFNLSGTSQAAPHVAGAVAVLRARYPREPQSQMLLRLQQYGVPVADPGKVGRTTPRLQLQAAATAGTSVTLTGSGPVQAAAGARASYTLTATNGGPLLATQVTITDTLPAGSSIVSLASGCTANGRVVTCAASALASGTSASFTITVLLSVGGPIYDHATVTLDQFNGAPPAQQQLDFGQPPQGSIPDSDGPLPGWSYLLLACLLLPGLARWRRA